MAWRKLAVALNNSGGSAASAVDAATRAYTHRDRLPELERYQTTAFYFWKVEQDYDKGIAAYRAVLAIDPNDLTSLVNLAAILNNTRQFAAAETLAVRALQVNPQTVAVYDNLMNSQLGQGKATEARATLDRLITEMPTSPAVGFYMVGFYVATGAFDSAAAVVNSAQSERLDLSFQAGIAFGRASLDRLRGRIASAEKHLREAATVSERRNLPGQAIEAAALIAGDQTLFLRDPALGLKTLDLALKRHPLSGISVVDRPYTSLAIAYAIVGQPAIARRYIAENETNTPEILRKNSNARNWVAGYLALAENRGRDAIAAFQRARDEGSCTNCAFFELGQSYEMANLPDSALIAYTSAVETPHDANSLDDRSFNDARTYRRLGELYEEKGQKEKALEYYGRFVELWKAADPALQTQVREVKDRMAKLAGEPTK